MRKPVRVAPVTIGPKYPDIRKSQRPNTLNNRRRGRGRRYRHNSGHAPTGRCIEGNKENLSGENGVPCEEGNSILRREDRSSLEMAQSPLAVVSLATHTSLLKALPRDLCDCGLQGSIAESGSMRMTARIDARVNVCDSD